MYWVLNGAAYKAEIKTDSEKIILSNGLVSRTVEKTDCRTVSFKNLQKDAEMLSAPRADFCITRPKNTVPTAVYTVNCFATISV